MKEFNLEDIFSSKPGTVTAILFLHKQNKNNRIQQFIEKHFHGDELIVDNYCNMKYSDAKIIRAKAKDQQRAITIMQPTTSAMIRGGNKFPTRIKNDVDYLYVLHFEEGRLKLIVNKVRGYTSFAEYYDLTHLL